MTFTLLTPILLVLLVLSTARGAFRGRERGLTKAALSFGSIIFSLFIGALIAHRLIGSAIGKSIAASLAASGAFGGMELESIGTVVQLVLSMAISAVVFIAVYIAMRLLTVIAVAIALRAVNKTRQYDSTDYTSENDSWYRRSSGPAGAVIGGICGFLSVIIMLAPISGTLKTADRLVDLLYSLDAVEENSSAEMTLDEISHYSKDFSCAVVDSLGGALVYDLCARAYTGTKTVVLTDELDAIEKLTGDLPAIGKLFSVASMDEDSFDSLESLCGNLGESHIMSLVVADFVSSACKSWNEGEAFMGIESPSVNEVADPLLGSVFSVMSATTQNTVSEDVMTLLDVCRLLEESGIFVARRYNDYMNILSGTLLDDITVTLAENPRMADISENLYTMIMGTLVDTIKFDGYNVKEYMGLLSDISDVYNQLGVMKKEKKVETLTGYVVEYLDEYGVDIPPSLATMVVSAMVDEAQKNGGEMDASFIDVFFESFNSSK